MKNEINTNLKSASKKHLKVTNATKSSDNFLIHEKSDLEIWAAFKQGNEGAFNHIYSGNFKTLYNFGCQLYPDGEVIKDIIQDLFIGLRAKNRQLGEVYNIKAYLFKALRRKVYDYKKTIKKPLSPNFKEFEIVFSIEQQIINQQLDADKSKFLAKLMNSLTNKQREVIFYYFYEGMSYQEIASILELSNVKSVRNLIYRSLNVMRKNKSGFDRLMFLLF